MSSMGQMGRGKLQKHPANSSSSRRMVLGPVRLGASLLVLLLLLLRMACRVTGTSLDGKQQQMQW
jgi:hypothetical protein